MKKMVTPTDFQVSLKAMDVSGHYEWENQVYQLERCKAGTCKSTSIGTQYTSARGLQMPDSNWDSIND